MNKLRSKVSSRADKKISTRINASKKLELVKAIRMQNQYNRQLFRSREGILYSDAPQGRYGELYSLEESQKPADVPLEENKNTMSGFRIRFMIALILLLSFVLCDTNHISYGGENTDTLFEWITSSPDITELLELVK